MPDNCIPLPTEGKYTEVRRYIEERKLIDPDFKAYCDTYSRTDLCQRLTREFGWVVDDHSLGRNIPQVEQAVRELIRQRGLPRTFTGIIEYNGFQIRVQRPKSYTWHLNTQIQDDDLEYYKRLHGFTVAIMA